MTFQEAARIARGLSVAGAGRVFVAVALLIGQLLTAAHELEHLDSAEGDEDVCEICLLCVGVDKLVDGPVTVTTAERAPVALAFPHLVVVTTASRSAYLARAPPLALTRSG